MELLIDILSESIHSDLVGSITFIEAQLNFILHFMNLLLDIQLDWIRESQDLIGLVDIVLMTAHNAHDVEPGRFSEDLKESLGFFIELRLVRVLVIYTLWDDTIIRLWYNSNQEVQQDYQVEELVEEPEQPNQINHALRVAPLFRRVI